MSKRILIVTNFFSPSVGGVETHLLDLCDILSARGFTPHVLSYQPNASHVRGPSFEVRNGTRIRRLHWFGHGWFDTLEPYPPLQFLYMVPGLAGLATWYLLQHAREIDIVHPQGLIPLMAVLPIAKVLRKRLIVSLHTIFRLAQRSVLARAVVPVLNKCDLVLTVSNAGGEDLIKAGVHPNRVRVFHYWIDETQFTPIDKKIARKQVGFPDDKIVALFVGRFHSSKGVRLVIEAARRCNAKELFFPFVGIGPEQVEIEKAAQENLSIRLVGPVSHNQLPLYYSAADVLVWAPVDIDCVGRVCMEALMCGLPVLAANQSAYFGIPRPVPSDLLPPQVGRLIDPTPEALASVLEGLVKRQLPGTPFLRSECRQFAQRKFGASAVEQIVAAYEH